MRKRGRTSIEELLNADHNEATEGFSEEIMISSIVSVVNPSSGETASADEEHDESILPSVGAHVKAILDTLNNILEMQSNFDMKLYLVMRSILQDLLALQQ